jgi:hypothetical protein
MSSTRGRLCRSVGKRDRAAPHTRAKALVRLEVDWFSSYQLLHVVCPVQWCEWAGGGGVRTTGCWVDGRLDDDDSFLSPVRPRTTTNASFSSWPLSVLDDGDDFKTAEECMHRQRLLTRFCEPYETTDRFPRVRSFETNQPTNPPTPPTIFSLDKRRRMHVSAFSKRVNRSTHQSINQGMYEMRTEHEAGMAESVAFLH